MVKRFEVERCGPSIILDNDGSLGMRGICNGGDILNVECL